MISWKTYWMLCSGILQRCRLFLTKEVGFNLTHYFGISHKIYIAIACFQNWWCVVRGLKAMRKLQVDSKTSKMPSTAIDSEGNVVNISSLEMMTRVFIPLEEVAKAQRFIQNELAASLLPTGNYETLTAVKCTAKKSWSYSHIWPLEEFFPLTANSRRSLSWINISFFLLIF